MSSLCLLSVDDVYEELRRAAECLMMHKIKPSLSAVLRLPSAFPGCRHTLGEQALNGHQVNGEFRRRRRRGGFGAGAECLLYSRISKY